MIVDIVDSSGHWRYLEDIPAGMLLTEDDVRACRHLLLPGRWVSVHLQQPSAAALAAAVCAHQAGCKVVLDGAPPEKHGAALLAAADVLRADARETDLLAGFAVSTAAVGHPGGRPSLTPKAVQDQLTLLAESTA